MELSRSTANRDDRARVDIAVDDFLGGCQRTYLDVKGFNPFMKIHNPKYSLCLPRK